MKRALTIISTIGIVIILLFGGLIAVLHMKSVQTYVIGKATEFLSRDLQVDVHISQFHYRPLSHLTIDSIYLSDQQKDTLAFLEQVELKFHPLRLKDRILDIEEVTLQSPYLNLQTLPDSTLNCQFLVSKFHRDSATLPIQISVNHLYLEKTRLRYNDLLIDQLDLTLAVPIISNDSLDFYIESLHLRAQIDQLDAKFETNIHGGLDSIYADNLLLSYRDQRVFSGNLAAYHPTKLDSLYIQANCQRLYLDSTLLSNVLAQLQLHSIEIPKPITNLQYIEYTGDISGRLEDMQLYGAFASPLGKMNVNGSYQFNTSTKQMAFAGQIATESLQLGKILGQDDLGCAIFDATFDGSLDSSKTVIGGATINIKQIDYRDYTYSNIHLSCVKNIDEMNGILYINDKNIQLAINGMAEWEDNYTHTNFAIQLADFSPHALHLTEEMPDLRLYTDVNIDLYGNDIQENLLDNIAGYIIFDSLTITNHNKQEIIKQISIYIDNEAEAVDEQATRGIRIQSDYITAHLSGKYSYYTLPTAVQYILNKNLPALITQPTDTFPSDINLIFYTYFKRLDKLSPVLDFGINISSYPTIKGHIRNKQMNIRASVPEIKAEKTSFEDITVAFNSDEDQLNLKLYALTHLPKDNPTAAKLGDIKTTFELYAADNNVDLDILLDNTDKVQNKGKISITSKISEYLNKPKFDIQVKPTNIILNDSSWSISPTDISYTHATQCLDINNLLLKTDYQSIQADGRASKSKEDSINVQLNNINLNYLLSYTEANKALSVQGPVTGSATLYSVLSGVMLEATAEIKEAGLNGVYVGDAVAQARLDKENNSILIDGTIIDSTQHTIATINGTVIPADKHWTLDIDCDSIDIGFINFWTKDILSNPQGRGYGHVHIDGIEQLVSVTGAALAKNAQITLPQIGSTYYFTDSIYLDKDAIRFPKIEINDINNNKGSFTGSVQHEYFTNFKFDLRAEANKMLVMDLPANQQSLFYGKVYGTGDVHIHGDERECFIDVNARTESKTKFYLNINSASQASQSDFIHFVKPDTTSNPLLGILIPKQETVENTPLQSKLRLSLQGEVTPQAEINILLSGDDAIKGKGEGNLKLVYESPSENIQMQGGYTLQSGQFSFSLGNIVRRNFVIREGSRITWDGDPLSPTLDITGHYHTTASLRDLFGSESAQIATNRTSVPVNCVLNMSEQLFNPILKFAIELPQSDESVQSQVNSMITTEEMLMRQIIYLLVFNRFYTPEYLQNTQNVGLNETYSLLSSTVTGQINSWLSKLTDIFTMGFNFRTDGEGETASQEYEANFQLHPINQLIINGNFGYRYNDLSNRPFFGDLDIEYLLTENGKVRIKAYTHTVDKYSLRQANTVQGVGLVFKHDFNWKKIKRDKKDDSTKKAESKENRKNKQKDTEDKQ